MNPEKTFRDGDHRRAYALSHMLLVTVACWACLAGLASVFLIWLEVPGDSLSALSILFPTWLEFVWAVSYAMGGALLLYGVINLKARFEISGAVLIAGTQFVNVYAITVIRGFGPGFISGVGIAVGLGLLLRVAVMLGKGKVLRVSGDR